MRRGRAQALATPGGLFLAATLALCALPVTSAIRDPDFWWHLRTGQLIADRHGLLTTDPFTYTATDSYWVNHSWLYDSVLYGLASSGIAMAAVLVQSFFISVSLSCHCSSRSPTGLS